MNYRAGTLVQVRSREEILASLDQDGTLDRMPFMPEMLQHCGKQFRVSAVAHKTCDTAYKTGGRRLDNAVHLDGLRCDGSAHGGCQATCLLFWKDAWLRPADESSDPLPTGNAGITEDGLRAAAVTTEPDSTEPRYSCQATRICDFTAPQPWWDVRQFWHDLRSGNASLGRAARVLTVAFFRSLLRAPIGYRAFLSLYQGVHAALNGFPAPGGNGIVPPGQATPASDTPMHVGDLVRVKPHEDIKRTLNANNKNRGMWFDDEMVKFCGNEYRVSGRVDRIIDEVTGKMLTMKQPCIVLDRVWCTAGYTDCRLLCPRAVTTYWRENWLERVEQS